MHKKFTEKLLSSWENGVQKIKPRWRGFEMEIPKLQRRLQDLQKPVVSVTDVLYMENGKFKNLIPKLTLLTENKYKPSPYMSHSVAQSLYNIRYSRTLHVNYKRELKTMADGGTYSLDWANPIHPETSEEYEPASETKILFVIHGLTGGSNMNYIKSMILAGQDHGYRCVAFNSRGINTDLTSPEPFNGECLHDLEDAFDMVHARYPNAKMFAVGASYGANMLLRWAGNRQNENYLTAMVGLATPFRIDQCIQKMGYMYEGFFVDRYKANCINPHRKMLVSLNDSHGICLKRLGKTKKLRDFHEEITIKYFKQKYNSVDHFFDLSGVSSEQIRQVTRPCLLMHSRDDPIVTVDCVPTEVLLENENIIQAETSHGAHVCWYSGTNPQRWYPKPVIQFFESVLESEGQTLNQNSQDSNS